MFFPTLVMTPEEVQRSKKPYRYGMILLCFGALINWIGLAENYTDPFRYAGVACIIGGALLICTAMCCWLHVPNHVGATEVRIVSIHHSRAISRFFSTNFVFDSYEQWYRVFAANWEFTNTSRRFSGSSTNIRV